jgi:hypothetical protein
MTRDDAIELLRAANPVRVENLPEPTESEDAGKLLASILSKTQRPDSRRSFVLGTAVAAALTLAAVSAVVAGAPGRAAIRAVASHVGSWLGSGGGIVRTDNGAGVAGVRANGIITSAASGGWFIAGGFTTVDGQERGHLAHIRADGSLDPVWRPGLAGPPGRTTTHTPGWRHDRASSTSAARSRPSTERRSATSPRWTR